MSTEFYETGCERESVFFHWVKIVNVSVRFVLSNMINGSSAEIQAMS
mgnify:CR=1 FL=1